MESLSAAEVVGRMIDAFATGDTSTVQEFVAPDYLDHQGLDGQPLQGADGFASVVRAARSGAPELSVRQEDVISDGTRVTVRLRWRSHDLERETIDIIRVADGRAAEHWGAECWRRDIPARER